MTTPTRTIAEQATALAAGSAAAIPAEIMAAFAAEQVALDANGVPDGIRETGTVMPDGELLDVQGAPTTLAQLRAGRAAVVVFYRGAWCPYCNIALRTYQADLVPALADRGVTLIAVSPQKPDGSLTAAESNELSYAVASDPGNQLAAAMGILTEPSADARAGQLKLGLDVAEVNADGTGTLPMPTVVVVDVDGIIRWIDVHPNYATRTEVPDVLNAVDAAHSTGRRI